MTAGSLSLSVRAGEVPAGGRRFHLKANEKERLGLAEELGIPEVTELAAAFEVRRLSGGMFAVQGTLAASVVQTDIVTLEPVHLAVNETIELTLAPAEDASAKPAAALKEQESDGPDLFHGGRIELGAIAREHLALGLDPYPRAAGVEFAGHVEDDSAAEASPFAALVELRKDEE
jgi:hypothetical protein